MEKITTLKFLKQPIFLRSLSAVLLIAAIGLTLLQFFSFKESQQYFASGTTIAGVPVGGLNHKAAGDHLFEAFSRPVEFEYQGNRIQVSPIALGFEMDIEAMVSEADKLTQSSSASAFWNHLWHRTSDSTSISVPLKASIDNQTIRYFLLNEIAPRYDQPTTQGHTGRRTICFRKRASGVFH